MITPIIIVLQVISFNLAIIVVLSIIDTLTMTILAIMVAVAIIRFVISLYRLQPPPLTPGLLELK